MSQARPSFSTVEVALPAPFDGWNATMRGNGVPARVFIELQSGDAGRAMHAVEKLVLRHNFLTDEGTPAASILDAPMDALTALIEGWSTAVAALPNR